MHLVSSNRENFRIQYDDTILFLYAGDIRVPPAQRPEPCGAINKAVIEMLQPKKPCS